MDHASEKDGSARRAGIQTLSDENHISLLDDDRGKGNNGLDADFRCCHT